MSPKSMLPSVNPRGAGDAPQDQRARESRLPADTVWSGQGLSLSAGERSGAEGAVSTMGGRHRAGQEHSVEEACPKEGVWKTPERLGAQQGGSWSPFDGAHLQKHLYLVPPRETTLAAFPAFPSVVVTLTSVSLGVVGAGTTPQSPWRQAGHASVWGRVGSRPEWSLPPAAGCGGLGAQSWAERMQCRPVGTLPCDRGTSPDLTSS